VVAAVNVVTGQRVAIKYLADRLFRDPKFLPGSGPRPACSGR